MPNWWEGPITQGFGPTNEPLDSGYNGYAHFNKGLDFGLGVGTAITSPVSGTVESAGDAGDGWGLSVKVRDAQGNLHSFGHLDGVSVRPGQSVSLGTALGKSGSTGKSTGPHLSYDVSNSSGAFIDPSRFLGGSMPGGSGLYDTPGADDWNLEDEIMNATKGSITDFTKGLFGAKKSSASPADGLRSYDFLRQSSDPMLISQAVQFANSKLEAALHTGDVKEISKWSAQVNALNAKLTDSSGLNTSPQSDPASMAQALASIYNASVNAGTMQADAASKALDAALKQANLTTDRTYVPGFGPGESAARALGSAWNPFNNDMAKYQKVDVAGPETITQGANSGFQDTLKSILGSSGMDGGGAGPITANVLNTLRGPQGASGASGSSAGSSNTDPVTSILPGLDVNIGTGDAPPPPSGFTGGYTYTGDQPAMDTPVAPFDSFLRKLLGIDPNKSKMPGSW